MQNNDLLNCKTADITKLKREELADISALEICGGSVPEKLACFIKSVKNPYCFRVKETPVKIVFSDKANSLAAEKALVNIAIRRFN